MVDFIALQITKKSWKVIIHNIRDKKLTFFKYYFFEKYIFQNSLS